ncbi:MAG: 4Fe-4S binding protein [Actinobacteria bacterium]|nr:4Fe-4S binding protein [Actinomycetota bacterium]MBU4302301.1 4Fe-4S binding protein [Actinomycetota bacterium]MBU4386414.1 4Fe-4S binding protein [Actinomycetota bacterium]
MYQQLAQKIFMGDSPIIPRLFEMLADPGEAELLLLLPVTAPELAKKMATDEGELKAMLDTLYYKGLVFKKETPEGTLYRLCRDLMQFHDASILWLDATREFLDLWQRFMEEEWPVFSENVDKMLPKPVTRIVPVMESLDARQQILAFEDVRQIIDDSEVIAVTNCTCRLTARKCDRPVEVCLQVGKAGSYAIDRGTGRDIDKEEALRLLRQAEEAGLIHTTMNRSSGMHFICNCCDDCCMIFPMLIDRKLNMCDPSRFCALVDAEACNACGDCLERCYFGALSMDDELEAAVVDPEACMGCGLCEIVCPTEALTLEAVRERDFIPTS